MQTHVNISFHQLLKHLESNTQLLPDSNYRAPEQIRCMFANFTMRNSVVTQSFPSTFLDKSPPTKLKKESTLAFFMKTNQPGREMFF